MNVTWMLGGPHRSRAYVDARAATIAVGLGELPPNQIRFPTVSVTYQFEQYATVMKIGGEMKAKNLLPRIYLWDTDKPEQKLLCGLVLKHRIRRFFRNSASSTLAQARHSLRKRCPAKKCSRWQRQTPFNTKHVNSLKNSQTLDLPW